LIRVRDVMHSGEALPLVEVDTPMTEVVASMTAKEVQGVAGVIDKSGSVIGVVTDGDIRRRLKRSTDPLTENAEKLMSRNPKTIDVDELAQKALFVMEQFRIQTLFVVDKSADNPQQPQGLLHIQDLIGAKIR